jgi:hypothetical protein
MRRYRQNQRFHVMRGDTRTTVSLDSTICELLALKLEVTPYSEEAHGRLRAWLQDTLDQASDPGRSHVSQWLTGEAVMFLADTAVKKRWGEWLDTLVS